MNARRRPLPEPGSPAFIGLADQHTAAIADATRHAAALVRDGAVLVGESGPWAQTLLFSVAPGAKRRLVCTTIGELRAPAPMFVVRPHMLCCRGCLDFEIEHERTTPSPCHVCGRPPGVVGSPLPVVAQRAHVIARGRLCSLCIYIERSRART